jgi:uncharacterized protein (DUF1499 family)
VAVSGIPSPAEVHARLARGCGSNFAATSVASDDPGLRPRVLPLDPDSASAAVAAAVRNLPRWRLIGERDGVIHATRRTRIFRLVDDVFVLLEPAVGGTAVSVQSESRAGRRDLGQNRRNILELWRGLGVSE